MPPVCLPVQSDAVFAKNTNEAMFRDVQLRSLAGSQIKYIDILKMSSSRPDGHLQNWIKEGTVRWPIALCPKTTFFDAEVFLL